MSKILTGQDHLPSGSKILTGNDHLVPPPSVNAYGQYGNVGVFGLAQNGVGYDDYQNVIIFAATAHGPSLVIHLQGQIYFNGDLIYSFDQGSINLPIYTFTVTLSDNAVGNYTFHTVAENSYAVTSSYDGSYKIKPAFNAPPVFLSVGVLTGPIGPVLVSWDIKAGSNKALDDPWGYSHLSHDPDATYADLYYNGDLIDEKLLPDWVDGNFDSWIDGFLIDGTPGDYAVYIQATNSDGTQSSTIPPGSGGGLTGSDGFLRFTIPGDVLTAGDGATQYTDAGSGIYNSYLGSFVDGNSAGNAKDFGAIVTWTDPANGDHITSGKVVKQPGTNTYNVYASNNTPYVSAGQYDYSVAIGDINGGGATISGTVQVKAPTLPSIGSLSVSPGSITTAGTDLVKLTANGVSSYGGVTNTVQYYLDSNHNGVLDPNSDRLIATGGTSYSGYLGGLAVGTYKVFARAYRYTYNSQLFSAVVSSTLNVTQAPPVTQVAIPLGSETTIETNTPGGNAFTPEPLVAADSAGNVAVVFSTGGHTFQQRYTAAGTANGPPEALSGPSVTPSGIAMRGDGQFVLVWDQSSFVYASIYSADGQLLAGPITVSSAGNVSSSNSTSSARVSMDASGNFVVTWCEGSYLSEDTFERRFSANGSARDAAPVKVNSTSGASGFSAHISPDVSMDLAGAFVIAWADTTANPSTYTIQAQRFDAAGDMLGGPITVGNTNLMLPNMAHVAMDPFGKFTVFYSRYGASPGAPNNLGLVAHQYYADGTPIEPDPFLVNTFPGGDHYLGGIAFGPSDELVVTWTSFGQDTGDGQYDAGVYGQVFAADGERMGGEFRVPTTTAGSQFAGDVVFDARGHITATWSGNGPGGYPGDFLQRFEVNLPPSIASIPTQQIALSGKITLSPVLSDPNGDTLSVRDIAGHSAAIGQTVTLASGAQVTLNADNSLTYQASSTLPAGAADTFTFTVADGLGGVATATVRFDYVAPTVTGLSLTSPTDAGAGTTLSGVISDPGTLDSFQVSVDWGDGVPMKYLLPATTTTFSITHDPTPGSTSPGLHNVSVSIIDGSGGGMSATAATTTGLVSYWKADGGTDDSAGSNSLTFVNPPAPAYAAGQVGQAFGLDGASSYLSAGAAVLNTQDSFSLDAWVNPTNAANGNQVLVSEIGQENAAGQYQLLLGPTGVVTFLRREGGGSLVDGFTTTNPIASNEWSHITAVYSSGEASFEVYVDGILQAGMSFTGVNYTSSVPAVTILGANDTHTEHFGGRTDEVALYNRALSAAEVAALDNAGMTGTPRDATSLTSFHLLDQDGNQAPGYSPGVTVPDVGPQNLSIEPSQVIWTGAAAMFMGAFTDPNAQNTHTYLWTVTDGNGQVVATGAATSFSFTPTAAGVYLITFQVTDNLGTSNSVTAKVTALDALPLAENTTSFQLDFNMPVLGADLASNYVLQSVASNGLGGVNPSTVIPLTVSFSGMTATFSFDPLPAGDYLLTVKDTITDTNGNPLDGAGSGDSASNFLQAFHVGAEPNDTIATSTVLPADWIQGQIGDSSAAANDVDMYRITLNAGDLISFNGFDHGGLATDGDIRLRLFDAGGTDITNQLGYWGTFYTASGGDFYFGASAAGNSTYDPTVAGSGTGGAWTGFYTLDYTIQNLTNVSENITSANHATFTTGSPGTFTIITTGFSSPLLSEAGALPAGVTFTDNGDGTATLAASASAGPSGVYAFTITAHNGISGDATQTFTLTLNEAPAITSADSALFVSGQAGSVTITTHGFPHPSLTETGALPANVTFKDNGDGSATLTGSLPAVAAGTFTITITAHNGIGSDASQTFTLTVGAPPTSSVSVLPTFSKPAFNLSWSGNTNVSGSTIAGYTIFVSDNGGAFTPFLTNTTQTSAKFTGAAQHTYAFYIVATDSLGDVQPTPSAAQATTQTLLDTPFKQYVAAVYLDLLLRSVDLGGLGYWSGLLDNGTARTAVAASLTHSAEYFQTNVIQPAYHEFLNRGADPGGLAYWTKQLQNGLTDEQMQAGYIASQEFYNAANRSSTPVSRTPAADRLWVDALYQSLLGRPPDQTGEDYWTNQLQGLETLLQVANGFTGSKEGLSVRIQQTYERYLGRPADAGGLAYWLTQYGKGAANEDIVTGFIGSDEFFKQATT